MNELARVVSTKIDGWQKQAGERAKRREPFKIRGIGPIHLAFCKQLCEKHDYKFTYDCSDKEFAGFFSPLE